MPQSTSTGSPFWRTHSVPPSGPLPQTADVVIVGGGITGISLLWHLAGSDREVILLERDHLAAGATGRNAGFLLAGVAGSYRAAALDHGRDLAAEAWHFTQANHDLIAAALRGADCGYARRGSLTLASSAAEGEELQQSAEMMTADALTARWQPPGPDSPHGSLLNPGDGEVDSAAAVAHLAQGVEAQIHTDTEVVAINRLPGGGEEVVTERGSVRAPAVILATNAFTSALLPAVPIRPVRAQMLATAPSDPVCPQPTYADRGHQYWRQLDGGELLVGGWRDRAVAAEVGLSLETTPLIQGHLESHARSLGGALAVTHRWSGTMGFTPDGLPVAGRWPGRESLLVVGGYTGHGMGFAFHLALRVAEQLTAGRPLPGWSDPRRFAGGLRSGGGRRR